MDRLDDFLKKKYKTIRGKLISPQKGCPDEALLWRYVKGGLKEKDREDIDGHLMACGECLECLQAIRMFHQAQESTVEVPAHLHERTREILLNALEMPGMRPKDRPVLFKLALLWDQVRGKVTQLASEISGMAGIPVQELQPVRRHCKDAGEFPQTLPYKKEVAVEGGTAILQIDRSGQNGYLMIKIAYQPEPDKGIKKEGALRAILYKSDRICSSVYLDQKGEAVFSRFTEGEYALELVSDQKSLGIIDIFIYKAPSDDTIKP